MVSDGKEGRLMKVTLIRYTPEPEATVALAARLCYSDLAPEDLAERLGPDEIGNLIRLLKSLGHESPFEHAVFSFAISGVSRSLSHQLVRHRIASYSQRSQRYVSEEGFDLVVPPCIKNDPETARVFASGVEAAREAYKELVRLGVEKEDARYVLPNACSTAVIVTMNARSLSNFFRLRCCNRAQWEIRALSYRMMREAKKVAPILFENAGPPCVSDNECPEGPMSCGKILRLRGEKER